MGLGPINAIYQAVSYTPLDVYKRQAMERLEYTAKISYLLRRIGAERDLPAAEIARLKAVPYTHLDVYKRQL